LCNATASADSIESAQTAYAQGRFAQSIAITESIDTEPAHALAAKSLIIQARYFAADDEKKRLLERAIEHAQRLIEIDPDEAEAYLLLATAMGRHAKLISRSHARKEDYAGKTREAIESALRIEPQSAAAHASMGRWHAGIIAEAGSLLARTLFKASRKTAIFHFEQSLELNSQSKLNKFEIATGYLELDESKYAEQARLLLMASAQLSPNDAYERIIHAHAAEKLALLEASGH